MASELKRGGFQTAPTNQILFPNFALFAAKSFIFFGCGGTTQGFLWLSVFSLPLEYRPNQKRDRQPNQHGTYRPAQKNVKTAARD